MWKLDEVTTSWQRPASAPFPAVYARHTGKRAMPNGQVPRFRIQDAPLEMEDEVADHMVNFFIKSEPMSMIRKTSENPVAVAKAREFWADIFRQRMTLVALVEEDDGTTRLAGVNMMCIAELKDKDEDKDGVDKDGETSPRSVIGSVLEHMSDIVNVFERYGVTEYLSAMGLSVLPEFQGQGLGLEILRARVPLCRAMGLGLTVTVFTAANSQELARRAGFETIAEVDYAEFKEDGKELFPGITTKTCKTMVLQIQ